MAAGEPAKKPKAAPEEISLTGVDALTDKVGKEHSLVQRARAHAQTAPHPEGA